MVLSVKFKLHDLQIFDTLLKRLATEQNPNSLPQYEPQLVIMLYGQLVASDFFPAYINGCPCQNILQPLGQDDYTCFCGKITTSINYHIIQRFYLSQFKSIENSIDFLFKNPDILMTLLQKQLPFIALDEMEPYIYNPRFIDQKTAFSKFLLLDNEEEYELVSIIC